MSYSYSRIEVPDLLNRRLYTVNTKNGQPLPLVLQGDR